MSDVTFYFKSKTELLAALEKIRPDVERADKASIAKHKRDEANWLKRFRETARTQSKEMLSWDYEEAKSRHRWNGIQVHAKDERGQDLDTPNCPVSMAEILTRAIGFVERMPDRPMRIKAGGQYALIHNALSLGIDKAGAVC